MALSASSLLTMCVLAQAIASRTKGITQALSRSSTLTYCQLCSMMPDSALQRCSMTLEQLFTAHCKAVLPASRRCKAWSAPAIHFRLPDFKTSWPLTGTELMPLQRRIRSCKTH